MVLRLLFGYDRVRSALVNLQKFLAQDSLVRVRPPKRRSDSARAQSGPCQTKEQRTATAHDCALTAKDAQINVLDTKVASMNTRVAELGRKAMELRKLERNVR